jgi:hypothetical protein
MTVTDPGPLPGAPQPADRDTDALRTRVADLLERTSGPGHAPAASPTPSTRRIWSPSIRP